MKHGTLCISLLHLQLVVLSLPARTQVSFFQPPSYAGSGDGFVADFNRDGKTDLLTSDGTMNLGNGDGTFTAGAKVSGTVLAVADFNGDGKPDVLEQGSGTLLVLLGNGDGTFQTTPVSTPIAAGLSPFAAVDLNGDGKTDVVGVSNSALYVYLNNGDGTFASSGSYNVSLNRATALSVGDFNGDHKIDIAISTGDGFGTPGQVIVLLGNGDGTFLPSKTSTGASGPISGPVGDFNGDGKLDLAINNCDLIYGCLAFVLLGNGDGTFQVPIFVRYGTAPLEGTGSLAVGDFNGDGRSDLVLQDDTFSAVSDAAQIFLGNGDGTFSNASNYVIHFFGGPSVYGTAVADFNGDGKLDVAVGGNLLLGNGNGTFQGIRLSHVPISAIGASVIGDFDKNGIADMAVVSSQSVSILTDDGSGALSLTQTYTLQQPGYAVVTADLNGDGNLDLVVVGTDSVTGDWNYSVLLGNGDGTFQPPFFYPQSVQTNALSYSVVVGDFNNDRKLDIATTLSANGALSNQSLALLLGNGDGTFAAPSYSLDEGASSLVSADFNGDGNADIAAGTFSPSQATAILFGKSDGTFQDAVVPSSLKHFGPVQFTADLNNDGKPDLISISHLALGNGDGTFTLLPSGLGTVNAIADFNGDGKLDVLVTQSSSPTSLGQSGVLLGNADGTFGSLINVPAAGGTLGYVLIADMNGDGRPDIVFSLSGTAVSGVAVLLNTTPKASPDFSISSGGSSTSQTVTAGQTAKFHLVVTPTTTFSGTVNLSCTITPAVTPAPTCVLSSASLHMKNSAAQQVTLYVSTTAPITARTVPDVALPPGTMPLGWTGMLLGSFWLWVRNRKPRPALSAPIVVLAFLFSAGCGASGPSPHTIPGTPDGTYTAAITASSGSLSHTLALTAVVQ